MDTRARTHTFEEKLDCVSPTTCKSAANIGKQEHSDGAFVRAQQRSNICAAIRTQYNGVRRDNSVEICDSCVRVSHSLCARARARRTEEDAICELHPTDPICNFAAAISCQPTRALMIQANELQLHRARAHCPFE